MSADVDLDADVPHVLLNPEIAGDGDKGAIERTGRWKPIVTDTGPIRQWIQTHPLRDADRRAEHGAPDDFEDCYLFVGSPRQHSTDLSDHWGTDAVRSMLMRRKADTETLAGALWTHTRPGGHAHPDTNAIHCCAYGEHVLRNAGYNGWGNGVEEFGWEYIHDRAVANNVVLLDYDLDDPTGPPDDGHVSKRGGGVAEGFVDDPGPVAYASGDSGRAVAGGTHLRNFLSVPAADGVGGYWLLLDEVTGTEGTIHTALHPNAAQAPTADRSEEVYTVPVGGPYPRSGTDVRLTVAYGTEPDGVTVHRGALADWEESFVGRYLYASYPAPADGLAGIVTALFPHDDDHPRAEFERIPGDDRDGIAVRQGPVTDRAVELSGKSGATVGDVTTTARAAVVRERDGNLAFAFLRRATRVEAGDTTVRASGPVSLALRGTTGNVGARTDTAVRFDRPDLEAVELNGTRTPADGSGPVEVTVPQGGHTLRLLTD